MRIGVFSDSYRPYTSGVVTSICTLKEQLHKLGHEVFIFAPGYPNYHDDESNIHRLLSIPAPTNRDFTLALPVSPRVSLLARKLKLDIVHVHSPFILGQIGAKCARRLELPLVFTYHTQYDQYAHYVPIGQELARDLTVKYSRNFCNRCDLVIAPSDDLRQLIMSYGVNVPIDVIPTGVDVERFSSGDKLWLRKKYNIPNTYRICLFVGRLAPEKNIDFLIKAFANVKHVYETVCLVIVATGPLEKELKKLAIEEGLQLGRDIIFTGLLPSDNLVNAYCGADIFTFTSLSETQGIVLAEAMAAGLPIAAVEGTGTHEMVENGRQGLLSAYELDSYGAIILRLLSEQNLYSDLAVQAPARAAELSAEIMASRIETRYRELALVKRLSPQTC
ncbi:MAG: glycosyltransferase family 4 protein [Candidatus Saccharibacteria bacterium]